MIKKWLITALFTHSNFTSFPDRFRFYRFPNETGKNDTFGKRCWNLLHIDWHEKSKVNCPLPSGIEVCSLYNVVRLDEIILKCQWRRKGRIGSFSLPYITYILEYESLLSSFVAVKSSALRSSAGINLCCGTLFPLAFLARKHERRAFTLTEQKRQ